MSPTPRVVAAPPPASKPKEEEGDLADVIYDYNSGVSSHFIERWHGIKEPIYSNPFYRKQEILKSPKEKLYWLHTGHRMIGELNPL